MFQSQEFVQNIGQEQLFFFFFSAGVGEKDSLELLGRIKFLPELSL